MALAMRRSIGELVGSLVCFGAVLGVLISWDGRVLERLQLLLATAATDRAAGWGNELRNVADLLVQAVRDQSIAHSPLLIFSIAGGALFIFMLRT